MPELKKVTFVTSNLVTISLDGDNCWPDLRDLPQERPGQIRGYVARLTGGMQSGKSSVMFRMDLPDGTVVLWETSTAMLRTIMASIEGREAFEAAQLPGKA